MGKANRKPGRHELAEWAHHHINSRNASQTTAVVAALYLIRWPIALDVTFSDRSEEVRDRVTQQFVVDEYGYDLNHKAVQEGFKLAKSLLHEAQQELSK